ncbi:hypothetical protein ACJ41O_012126 [Fusarium nematophilum]
MATGQQRRAERLNERLRGAQHFNVEDESFHIDIAGLNIAGSTPAAPAPAPPTSSVRRTPNTSAKRKRLDNEIPPPSQERGSARRRSPRTSPRDAYQLPDTSKEPVAQVGTGGLAEQEETTVDYVEEPEPELPSPTRSADGSTEIEAEVALPVLPNGNVSGSPARQSSGRAVQDETHSPPDRRRNLRMSDALSSTARLHDDLHTEEDAPPSSSPLVRKVRRSVGPSAIRSRLSQRQDSRLRDRDDDEDELSPDRPRDHSRADDEMSDTNPVEEREDDADVDEEAEDQPPEEEVAEEIDEAEAAKQLGRKRIRRSLPSQSPDAEPEEQEEEEEPAPKRRRGRPSRSPATQKQLATKSRLKADPKPKPRETKAKTKAKEARKSKQAAKDRRVSDGTAIEITVQRFVNVKTHGKGADDEDPLSSEVPFANRGETIVDVFAQVCIEVIDAAVAKFYETATSTEDRDKKKECRIKIRALEAYKEELNSRLLQLAIHLNDWHSLRKRVRLVQREKLSLREEILRLKAEREQVALQMDAVRIKHEEDTKESQYRLDTSDLMHNVDLAVERGRDAPELSRAQEKTAELANLELLVARITDEASSASAAGGMLQQVKDFNAFLERAAVALESR